MRLIRRSAEYLAKREVDNLPTGLRGIYVLYQYRRKTDSYNVVYVGMTRSGRKGGIRGRLRQHRKLKSGLWSHCSVFEAWENIRDEEIIELEGLFRHIYGKDSRANKLNIQQRFRKLTLVNNNDLSTW